MKKRVFAIVLFIMAFLAACGAPPEEPEQAETEGRLLILWNTEGDLTTLLVTADGEPIVLTTDICDAFCDCGNGSRVRVTHSGIAETFPAQAKVYDYQLLEEGSLSDVPKEALEALENLGWNICPDDHEPAEAPQTVEDPISGYCGNTVTTVKLGEEEYSFWGDDSVVLTDILINLAYDPNGVCRCLPEFTVDTEFGAGYGVNLTEFYARCEAGQAALTEEQAETIRGILDRNCK